MAEYDVSKYTDEELLEILESDDINDPTLEAKIIQSIQTYMYDKREEGKKRFQFFKDVYEHFFDITGTKTENDASDDASYSQEELLKYDYNTDKIETARQRKETQKTEIENNKNKFFNEDGTRRSESMNAIRTSTLEQRNESLDKSLKNADNTLKDNVVEGVEAAGKTMAVKDLEYVPGKVNPILKETYRRIVTVDSKFRDDDLYVMSTDFTLNFSETLKDVVSMKLYAVQLPVTWYTISDSYGSNFFYLRPIENDNTYGLQNEFHEYKVEIEPGNYQPKQLVEAVNQELQELANTYPDVSFGNTNIVFDDVQVKSTLQLDIQKVYTEADYEVVYSDEIITCFEMDSPHTDISMQNHSPITFHYTRTEEIGGTDISWSLLTNGVNPTRKFEIIQYVPSQTYPIYDAVGSTTLNTIEIEIVQDNISRTTNEWVNVINEKIQTMSSILDINHSKVEYVPSIESDSSQEKGTWYWTFLPNRTTIRPIPGAKWILKRPDMEEYTNFFPSPVNELTRHIWKKTTDITASTSTSTSTSQLNNQTITFRPRLNEKGGVYIDPVLHPEEASYNDIVIAIADGQYTKEQLVNTINAQYLANPYTYGSTIVYNKTTETQGQNTIQTETLTIQYNINRIYTSRDYKLVFYDVYSFGRCVNPSSPFRNAKVDSTLGYILGYKTLAEYELTQENVYVLPGRRFTYFQNPDTGFSSGSVYTYQEKYDTTSHPFLDPERNPLYTTITLKGNAVVNIHLYNYFMILLDDFNQNHLNDGLVTLAQRDTGVSLPSYANRKTSRLCNPTTNTEEITPIGNNNNDVNTNNNNKLTQKQIYSVEQIIQTQNDRKRKNYNENISVKDMFALLPVKASTSSPGSIYVEFGGTLQQQERTYFGPVNVGRISVKLVNDKGDVVDLNGGEWSFQLVCDQLYQSGAQKK